MEIIKKQCNTCGFNFENVCARGGEKYKNGDVINEEAINCYGWSASLEYFKDFMNTAPWFIKEPYDNCKISFNEFLELYDKAALGEYISINIVSAIVHVYGLKEYQIAEFIGESVGVVINSILKYVPEKRKQQYANTFCIPILFFDNFSNQKLKELEKYKEKFFSLSK